MTQCSEARSRTISLANQAAVGLTLALCVMTQTPAAHAQMSDVRQYPGDSCPVGTVVVSYEEAMRHRDALCRAIGQWDIVYVGGGSMDGAGYQCRIRPNETRRLKGILCRAAAVMPPPPPVMQVPLPPHPGLPDAPYRIYAGPDYRAYSNAELQRRVFELERAVMQLQQRVYSLEAAPPTTIIAPPPVMPWTCTMVNAFGKSFTQTAPSRGEASSAVTQRCADDTNAMHCKNLQCSQ